MKNFLNHFLNVLIIFILPAVLLANFDVPANVTGFVILWVNVTTAYFNWKEPKP